MQYRIICYPSHKSYIATIEAKTFEEAMKLAAEEANLNCEYYATHILD